MEESTLFGLPYLSAVIVAAGGSARMGGEDKQFLPILGIPVLARSLMAFQACPVVKAVVVAARSGCEEKVRALAGEYGVDKLTAVVCGGETRADSVMDAIAALPEETEFVAIHDGARPLIRPEDIARCADDAFSCGGAVLGVPVSDTIKYVKKNGTVEYTPAREKLVAVQTPQIFDLRVYLSERRAAGDEASAWTDDSRVFENSGRRVTVTPGSRDNIKITVPEDAAVAEALLRLREGRL